MLKVDFYVKVRNKGKPVRKLIQEKGDSVMAHGPSREGITKYRVWLCSEARPKWIFRWMWDVRESWVMDHVLKNLAE